MAHLTSFSPCILPILVIIFSNQSTVKNYKKKMTSYSRAKYDENIAIFFPAGSQGEVKVD
jgi:cytochrome c biogenesis protein CcdA